MRSIGGISGGFALLGYCTRPARRDEVEREAGWPMGLPIRGEEVTLRPRCPALPAVAGERVAVRPGMGVVVPVAAIPGCSAGFPRPEIQTAPRVRKTSAAATAIAIGAHRFRASPASSSGMAGAACALIVSRRRSARSRSAVRSGASRTTASNSASAAARFPRSSSIIPSSDLADARSGSASSAVRHADAASSNRPAAYASAASSSTRPAAASAEGAEGASGATASCAPQRAQKVVPAELRAPQSEHSSMMAISTVGPRAQSDAQVCVGFPRKLHHQGVYTVAPCNVKKAEGEWERRDPIGRADVRSVARDAYGATRNFCTRWLCVSPT